LEQFFKEKKEYKIQTNQCKMQKYVWIADRSEIWKRVLKEERKWKWIMIYIKVT